MSAAAIGHKGAFCVPKCPLMYQFKIMVEFLFLMRLSKKESPKGFAKKLLRLKQQYAL